VSAEPVIAALSGVSGLEDGDFRSMLRTPTKEMHMPKYVIERRVPGVGKMSPADLQGLSQKSCDVLRELGPRVQWQQSYVTDDKIYCVYIADSEQDVLEHARKGGFPADSVSEVRAVIDPSTAG
jgi:hypothetical protein